MIPVEFVIPERPVSQQSRRRDRVRAWRDVVAARAREAVGRGNTLIASPVALRLLYLYDEVLLDVDNILKPIHDALIGVVLEDDSIISDVEIRRRRLGLDFTQHAVTPTLAAGLELGTEFVYISLSDAPPQDVLT